LMPQSKFVTASGAGHLLHFEAVPEVVAAVVAASRYIRWLSLNGIDLLILVVYNESIKK